MATSVPPDGADEDGLIAQAEGVLSAALDGDPEARLRPPQGHRLSSLLTKVDQVLDQLATERQGRLAYRAELEERLAAIEQLGLALRELSTPIIEVWRGVLCLPLVGPLDSRRSAHMRELLLAEVLRRNSELVILDITGIENLDSGTVSKLLAMASSIRLIGASFVLTGVQFDVADALVAMGADLSQLRTFRSVRDALGQHLRR